MAVKKKPEKKPAATEEEQENEQENEAEDEAPLTKAEVSKMVNGALAAFAKKKLPALLEGALAPVVAKLAPKKDDEDGNEDEDDEDETEAGETTKTEAKAPKAEAKPAKKTAADKKVAKLQQQVAAMEAERKAEKEKALRAEERAAVMQGLTAGGVRKEQIAALTTYLLSEDSGRLVRRDAEGAIVFVSGEDDEAPVAEGLKAWLGTDEGKAYVAPRGATGSNNTGPAARPGRPPVNGATAAQQRAAVNQQLDNELFNLVLGMPLQGGQAEQ